MNVRELSLDAPRAVAATVVVSTSSAQSSTLSPGDYVFVCDQGCSVVFGSNPTATTSHPRIPANTVVRFASVQANEKIAIIADAAGTAHIWRG